MLFTIASCYDICCNLGFLLADHNHTIRTALDCRAYCRVNTERVAAKRVARRSVCDWTPITRSADLREYALNFPRLYTDTYVEARLTAASEFVPRASYGGQLHRNLRVSHIFVYSSSGMGPVQLLRADVRTGPSRSAATEATISLPMGCTG